MTDGQPIISRLPIALIGCGMWGSFILRDLLSLGCEVSVVARSPATRLRAEQLGANHLVDSIAQLDNVSGVVVCVPISQHFQVVSEVLDLVPGVPIYCEKPLTDSAFKAELLAKRAPNHLFVMDKWRYHSGILELAKIARSGELGRVLGITCSRFDWGERHADIDPVWVLLPHDLAIVYEILGHFPEPVSAVADYAGKIPCGITAMLKAGGGAEGPWAICQVSARSPIKVRSVQLYCEHGVAVLGDSYAESVDVMHSISLTQKCPEFERHPIAQTAEAMPLRQELAAFISYLQPNGIKPKSSAAFGAELVSIIEHLRALAGMEH